MPSRSTKVLLAVLALVLAGLSTGAAAASGTLASTTIGTCANKRTGALRLAKKCERTEKAYKLSQVGPRGLTGPAGPVGLTGAVGPAGPHGGAGANGTVAVYYDAVASATLTSSLNYATVATLPLPAGSYAISSKVNVYNAGSGELNARCELQSGSVSDESESNINAEYSAMFPDQIVVTLNAPSVASLSCVGAVTLDQIKITAIPVSGVAESATS